ncbi:cytochrome P450 78A5-like [Gastrolobium bilobum]|uniref:cytochrome P450 78A5-like n=1 Tax=Gastrolobium bilobum TaxID=150636 RepID=UPI002AAF4672|nr:cytochrome P450 78A5-like [Gastrolobium bilobum]
MTPEFHYLFFPELFQAPFFSFQAAICTLLFTLAFLLWLSPGGLAWALKFPARSVIPGPSGRPVSGLLSVFSGLTPHRALAKLARTYQAESLMAFSVGLTRFVISSEPESAKDILGSSGFADRPVKESAYELLFHRAMGFAPYGEYWRNLRRISATHLFCPRRILGFEGFRREVGLKMVEELKGLMVEKGRVEVKKVLHFGSLNNVMMTVFGKSYEFGDGGDGVELEGLVKEGYELLGVFNWSDHFPLLGWLDLQGVRKRCRCLVTKVNAFVGKIIEDHRMKKVSGEYLKGDMGDFVDVLLDLEKEDKLGDSDMIAVLWEMIFRGTDTVAILLEWILARMVLHPEIQAKAQEEIDAVVGKFGVVKDADVPNLRYLQCIVKEALRVHPPGPLLSWARLAIHDVEIGDKHVPAGTTAMVNMWAITHNEKLWAEPEEFKPERFMEEDVSIMGSDLRLAPFGSGRRVCPGKAMGLASVHLWLAQLLQSFKWVPDEDGSVDLSERLKLSMEMKTPLVCKVVSRVVAA